MSARLKSFELHGYKTFAAHTEFIFADGVTAIVGPNGSGKSNIADALRWVLGEQSFGLLRAKKTEDMIFVGSEQRPRAGMASATIVFDNSDGWLPIDFSEVAITRRAYRDGDNEYLLNGQRVRLKDVSELLAQSGLAERTYTVIGQGVVDAALALKADERRRLFEEAAGIGLYRSRREDALRRLDTTQRNLERVEDILAELQPRLRSLERQSRRAQEYEQVKADLQVVLREWYGYHWHAGQSDLRDAQESARQQESRLDIAKQAQIGMDEQLNGIRSRTQELRDQLGQKYRAMSGLSIRREEQGRNRAVEDERLRLLSKQHQDAQQNILVLQGENQLHQEQLDGITNEIGQLQGELDAARKQTVGAKNALQARQAEYSIAEKEVLANRNRLSELIARQAHLQLQLANLEERAQRDQEAVQTTRSEVDRLEQACEQARTANQSAARLHEKAQKEFQAIESNLADLDKNILIAEAQKKDAASRLDQAGAQHARLKAKIDVLEQAEQSLSGYAKGAQLLLGLMKDSRLLGASGSLGPLLTMPEEIEPAIATAMGEFVDAVVIDRLDAVDPALEALVNESARGALLPLEGTVPAKILAIDLDKAPGGREAILGVASQLVEYDPQLRPIVEALLGQVLVVRDRSTARKILQSGDWRNMPQLRVVTLRGELFHASGPILAGATGQGVLSRPRLLREARSEQEVLSQQQARLAQELDGYNQELSKFGVSRGKLNERLAQARQSVRDAETGMQKSGLALEKMQRELDWQRGQNARIVDEIAKQVEGKNKIVEEQSGLAELVKQAQEDLRAKSVLLNAIDLEEDRNHLVYWETQSAIFERGLSDAKKRHQEKQSVVERSARSESALDARILGLGNELNELRGSLDALRGGEQQIIADIRVLEAEIAPLEKELEEAERTQSGILARDVEMRQGLSMAEHHTAQAKILLARRQEALDSLRRRIEDDFGLVSFDYAESVSGPKPLPLGDLVAELPKVVAISPELEDVVQRQRAQLRRMGPVNPEAQAEYLQVKERYDFLVEQVGDLTKAQADIREVITELDVLMEREFRKTFEAVAQEFRQIFTRLFGGGSARLVLTDPDDLTGTGVDIEARLPGRREQGLSLLSGGERSLTAVALVFSLLTISPTPFCILDEVDAMLDEANVGRFRDLLLELSAKTQFIVVTHNRNTVQAAGIIYGVTMGRDSSSQVISLRLDELGEQYGVQTDG